MISFFEDFMQPILQSQMTDFKVLVPVSYPEEFI